ncbi:hypothetical protein [Puniceibacterium confluentis]|uniref:hypothetical protein n=1 Tax=Puniceibacterium confluentis TaxID=1958944 RepID=UPI0011B35BDA|nr:hypothetical protein [Puniceibacterium confluentis]
MALTNAEKQRAFRDRRKQERLDRLKRAYINDQDLFQTPFSEWIQGNPNYIAVDLSLALIGIEAPVFEDERGASEFAFPEALSSEGDNFSQVENALGRAEVIVGCLLTAAIELAGIVNSYKKEEIENRLKELENPESIDRKSAMKEAVNLHKKLEQLNKQVRWSLPEWKDSE